MAPKAKRNNRKSKRKSLSPDEISGLIKVITGCLVAIGILIILGYLCVILPPDQQQRILPFLTGLLGVIIGHIFSRANAETDS